MDSSPSLETVCQAIYALYHNPDTSGKEKASVWLGELQRSVFAWKIADDLLHHNVDLESCYFAAQTMRTKIQYAFHELPPESHTSLRDSLLEHISHVTQETASVIVTQLCLALADLALQMATWKSPVADLIDRFGNATHHLPVLLEVLTVLPEEVNSRSLRLGANRRSEVIESFNHVSPQVLQLLNACMQTLSHGDPRIHTKVFRCLGSWLSIGGFPSQDTTLHTLLKYVFQALIEPQTAAMVHEAASDCICSALLLIEDVERHSSLAEVLFQGVYSLVEPYHISVTQEDIDKSINYCRMFTELAESLMEEIISSPNKWLGNLQTLDLLLTCVGHHDYEVAEITFNFWYRLSEVLYKRNIDSVKEKFQPYIQRLIVSLCHHCQLDPDHDDIPEDGDDFSEFRTRVSDLIKDVVYIVGSSNCFQQMFENLRNQGSLATWEMSEASLFVMAAVAKNVIPEENTVVPQVVEAILNLPPTTHIAVRYTSTQLLGELCEWIEKHPQYLDPVLNFLLSCLQQKQLATIGASALQNICSACRNQMASHFGGLLQIIRALDTFSISNEAAVGLLKGTALILAQMPSERITAGLKELCSTQVNPLSKLLREGEAPKEGTKSDPAIWLDRLAAIFRHTNPSVSNGQIHPCQPVIGELWPVLSETCNKYQADVRIIERCCRCIRFAIRCVGKQSASLLEPLVTQMVHLYQLHQHSCFLYLGSILVDEYGSEPGCVQGLLDMLQAFCVPTFRLLECSNGLRNHPDTVDDLFRLCTRFLQKAPVILLQSSVLKAILRCALASCVLDHKDANASVMKFFYDLIKGSRLREEFPDFHQRHSLIRGILIEHGQSLVSTLIQACVFHLPSYMFPDVADVIFELLHFDKQLLSKWLEEGLKFLPVHSSSGTVTATPQQMMEFHANIMSADHVKKVSASLRDFSRLYR